MDKTKLKDLSIADLKAMLDYASQQVRRRSFGIDKWKEIVLAVDAELEYRIRSLFKA